MTYPKKLIEVALPLEAINKESSREKSIRHGHPSTLHLWWARRPLAAARAVLFSSLVDDPSEYIENEEKQKEERERLFQLIEELVKWENINNDKVLDKAKLEIARSVARNMGEPMPVGKKAIEEFLATKAPPVLDPFAGGGTIPLEAQRLGLRAYASDLNPVAVLINKALIEIPPKFANMPPIHPPKEKTKGEMEDMFAGKEWKGAEGLAEDVRYYGQWMRDEAKKRIGHLYPKVKITQEMLNEREDLRQQGLKPGDEVSVIAWLWARTVTCSNPACEGLTPILKSFTLSRKKERQFHLETSRMKKSIKFTAVRGQTNKKGNIQRNGAHCLICNSPITLEYIRAEGQKGQIGNTQTAIVVEVNGKRTYLSVPANYELPILDDLNILTTNLPEKALGFSLQLYGLNVHRALFTTRQLHLLRTYCELLGEVKKKINQDINRKENSKEISTAYENAVITYLGLGISKLADYNSSLSVWSPSRDQAKSTFTRHAMPMIWDYSEVNPFAGAAGDFLVTLKGICKTMVRSIPATSSGTVIHQDARDTNYEDLLCVSTDPPYYDNVPYADLSDFFYVWLRLALSDIYPEIFRTLLVPKHQELIAEPYRFGGKTASKEYFEEGLEKVFKNIYQNQSHLLPLTIYYAFKQTEVNLSEGEIGEVSTGWETILQALCRSQYQITGTWPIRTEREARSRSIGSNALATSIVIVCRPAAFKEKSISRRDFMFQLKKNLEESIRNLQQGNIAPVDLAQASIGPGMGIYSQYEKVLEADGTPMSIRSALSLINRVLDEVMSEQEGDYDSDTRWTVAWYEQYRHEKATFGIAETLSKAKNTSIQGLVDAGILESRAGHVRLLRRDELDEDWSPEKDKRLTTWEAAQYLIRALDQNGEQAAAELLARLGTKAEPARELAYRLYTICERKGWAQDALGYNMLVVAWPRLKELASKISTQTSYL